MDYLGGVGGGGGGGGGGGEGEKSTYERFHCQHVINSYIDLKKYISTSKIHVYVTSQENTHSKLTLAQLTLKKRLNSQVTEESQQRYIKLHNLSP